VDGGGDEGGGRYKCPVRFPCGTAMKRLARNRDVFRKVGRALGLLPHRSGAYDQLLQHYPWSVFSLTERTSGADLLNARVVVFDKGGITGPLKSIRGFDLV
jgi:hypothetical protein